MKNGQKKAQSADKITDEDAWTPVHTNRVRQHRLELGLTQKQLADALNTSQQQVQRIEAGQIVRLDMALAICSVLKEDLAEIFPKAAKLIQKLQRKKNQTDDAKLVSKAGMDADPRHWTVIFETSLGCKGFLRMNSEDTQRFQNCLLNVTDEDSTFFVADHEGLTVALNLKELRYANVCFDIGIIDKEKDSPIFPDLVENIVEQENAKAITVFMRGRQTPLFFGVEPDSWREEGELNRMMYVIDSYDRFDENIFVSFTDEDGENVFLSIKDIVLMSVNKEYLDPELFDATMEDERDSNN
jgi:transcriptional regulator with XRE-family HTH domain